MSVPGSRAISGRGTGPVRDSRFAPGRFVPGRFGRGRALAASFAAVLVGACLLAAPASAADPDACGLVTQAELAKAFGMKNAIKHVSVISAPGNAEGVVSVRCKVFTWSGPKPLNDRQRREAILDGRMAILTMQTWVPDQGPNAHLWRERFEEFLKQVRGTSSTLFLEKLHGVRLMPPTFGADESVAWRADIHRTRRVRGLWWSRGHKTLLSMNAVEARGKPVVQSVYKVAQAVVSGVL